MEEKGLEKIPYGSNILLKEKSKIEKGQKIASGTHTPDQLLQKNRVL